MDFNFSEDQNAIRELAFQIFTDRATDEFLLDFSRSGKTYDESLWQTLADQGLLGIAVPESCGGSGLGLVELCLILEEQGRRVAPTPVYASLVLGGLPIAEFGTEEQQSRYLGELAKGACKLSAAIAEVGMNAAVATQVRASRQGEQWVLTGERSAVPDGAVADYILVPAQCEEGETTMFIVDTALPGVTVKGVDIGLSGERAANLALASVELSAEAALGAPGQGEEILEWLLQHANVGHCALQVGVTEEAMRRTAEYVSERKQFGIPLGTFQALAMRMADSYIDVEGIRSTYWLAMWRLSEGVDARAEVRIAKWWACDAAHRVVSTAQHLHGGMGADVEYPIHRFFLMAKLISFSLGNATQQLEQLGQLLAEDDGLGYRALEV
ncbi:acyl-CoA dehydrogenase family protein [Candidatus Marimicrobium litorale]|uniref:Acyl-CoA dehydrogenase n=1 Tax=Candidatus Marimicrobium litorale TaxID=2518991 RepID=A0ABT3T3Y6_9GAMM|nr:acyl-CoA/acyl-ACP dehydrogenase [Candidatus Marimicrobium litorale]MCX2976789.1 acyl-CoA dehydrogenase [Candidatus Marimicrobium litorale]